MSVNIFASSSNLYFNQTNNEGSLYIEVPFTASLFLNSSFLTSTFYVGSQSSFHTYHSSASFAIIELVGAGGGGGAFFEDTGPPLYGQARGGGGGSYINWLISTLPTTSSFTLTSGGAGATIVDLSGSNGGSSEFHDGITNVIAGGGQGGASFTASAGYNICFGGGEGGSVVTPPNSGIILMLSGGNSEPSICASASFVAIGGSGGKTFLSHGGPCRLLVDGASGSLGSGGGAGGGSSGFGDTTGGAGGPGCVIIHEFS